MKNIFFILFLLIIFKADAQYYYKDLLAAAEIMQQMKIYKENKIQKVISTGYTPGGTASADYDEMQETYSEYTQLIITTTVNQTVTRLIYKFDDQEGRLQTTVDSSAAMLSTSAYTYDKAGKLVEISNRMTDSSRDFIQTETHVWIYNNDVPEKMWRIINKTDSLEIRFKADANGNITEEQNFKKGKASDLTYYYYDDKNRLTDIVRYNTKAKRLLPDFMFEYDDQSRVIQKITTTSNLNLGYLTWRYLYNENGLKTKEALFNKEKQLQGRIDYSYISN
jgi:YD repeat-containing protein